MSNTILSNDFIIPYENIQKTPWQANICYVRFTILFIEAHARLPRLNTSAFAFIAATQMCLYSLCLRETLLLSVYGILDFDSQLILNVWLVFIVIFFGWFLMRGFLLRLKHDYKVYLRILNFKMSHEKTISIQVTSSLI